MNPNMNSIILEMVQDHQAIHKTTQRIQDLLSKLDQSNSKSINQSLVNLISFLSFKLKYHFYTEENFTLYEVSENNPEMAPNIQQLFEEHQHLQSHIDFILESAQNSLKNNDPNSIFLSQEFSHFLWKLKKHESSENQFIKEVFHIDPNATE